MNDIFVALFTMYIVWYFMSPVDTNSSSDDQIWPNDQYFIHNNSN